MTLVLTDCPSYTWKRVQTTFKDIIKLFDEQTIHIWSAILMKKRVAVYSDRLPHVLRVIRALPLFAFHRQDWDVLRPYVVCFHLDWRVEDWFFIKIINQFILSSNHLLMPTNRLLAKLKTTSWRMLEFISLDSLIAQSNVALICGICWSMVRSCIAFEVSNFVVKSF